jgi:hypothetical protein
MLNGPQLWYTRSFYAFLSTDAIFFPIWKPNMIDKFFANVDVQVNTLDPGTVNTKMLRAGWGS